MSALVLCIACGHTVNDPREVRCHNCMGTGECPIGNAHWVCEGSGYHACDCECHAAPEPQRVPEDAERVVAAGEGIL